MTTLTMQLKAVALFGFMASMLGMTACSQPASETSTDESSTETTTDAPATTEGKKIRIATEGAYPPFNYTTADGKLAGYDIDIANALCAQMKADCEIVAQEWDGIIPGLKANKYDAIIAGMEVTDERKEVVDFASPYFVTSMVWVAKKDGGFDPESIADKSLGAQRATTMSAYLVDNLENKDGNTVNMYDTYDNAYLDLKSGRLDAVLTEKAPATTWVAENTDYALVGNEMTTNGEFGIAVRKGDALKAEFDAALAAIRSNGEFDKIEQEYFGQ